MFDELATVQLKSGVELPAIGIGTWMMGEEPANARDEMAAIRRSLELGMSVVDTAEMYADGQSEMIVGKALQGMRDNAFVVSKVFPWNANASGTIAACEASLDRLGIECLDLYLLHWRGSHPLDVTVEAFETLKRQGKIKAWGVSNFDTQDMQQLLAVENGQNCEVNQILYNLGRRGPEYDLLPFLQGNNIAVMAYSPIEQGKLLADERLVHMAKAYQATPAQICLAFLLERDGILAIPKTTSTLRVEENFGAFELDLTDEDLSELDQLFPPPCSKTPLEML
jgi:diketogulonate reductase-like aldo/keto reductase